MQFLRLIITELYYMIHKDTYIIILVIQLMVSFKTPSVHNRQIKVLGIALFMIVKHSTMKTNFFFFF